MVRPERFELPAFWFVARRSIQLSYGRTVFASDLQIAALNRPLYAMSYEIDSKNSVVRDAAIVTASRRCRQISEW